MLRPWDWSLCKLICICCRLLSHSKLCHQGFTQSSVINQFFYLPIHCQFSIPCTVLHLSFPSFASVIYENAIAMFLVVKPSCCLSCPTRPRKDTFTISVVVIIYFTSILTDSFTLHGDLSRARLQFPTAYSIKVVIEVLSLFWQCFLLFSS